MAVAIRRAREPRTQEELGEYGVWVADVHAPGHRIAAFMGGVPQLVYGAPDMRFLLVAEPPSTAGARWFGVEPDRPPRDLGPLPTVNWPHTFSDDGRRSVVVELEDQSDVWLLRWPSQDSARKSRTPQ